MVIGVLVIGVIGDWLFGTEAFKDLVGTEKRDRSRSADGRASQQQHNFKDVHVFRVKLP